MSNDNITIRPEQPEDYAQIRRLVKEAFAEAEHTDGDEHNLIDRLRKSDEYIPELSLVAWKDGRPAGYIMFSQLHIGEHVALALAPLAVDKTMQKSGIGSMLVKRGHEIARLAGYKWSVVLGYPAYYSRFGYVKAADYNVRAPFDVADEYFMILNLNGQGEMPSGDVVYSPAFGL